jgi:hypothetical protein
MGCTAGSAECVVHIGSLLPRSPIVRRLLSTAKTTLHPAHAPMAPLNRRYWAPPQCFSTLNQARAGEDMKKPLAKRPAIRRPHLLSRQRPSKAAVRWHGGSFPSRLARSDPAGVPQAAGLMEQTTRLMDRCSRFNETVAAVCPISRRASMSAAGARRRCSRQTARLGIADKRPTNPCCR